MKTVFDGTKVSLGGREFVLPPLSMKQLRNGVADRIREHDRLVGEADAYGAMTVRSELVLTALRRNYPDFPEDEFYDLVDVGNVGRLWMIVLGLSGVETGGAADAAGDPTTSGHSIEP